MKKSMISVAYDLMKTKRKPTSFLKIWKEVSQIIGFTQQQEEDNIAQFYSDLSLDDRFVCVGNNQWDLRSRRTFSESVIDTDEIYIDEDSEESFDDYPLEKDKKDDYR